MRSPYFNEVGLLEYAAMPSTNEKPVIDIQTWERVLNGNGIKIIHSVNNGEYGGESIIMWDEKLEKLVSWYFTTAGFYTQAEVQVGDNKISVIEKVKGSQNGISEVKSTTDFFLNGDKETKAHYLQNGKWIEGHSIFYKESPQSKVLFK